MFKTKIKPLVLFSIVLLVAGCASHNDVDYGKNNLDYIVNEKITNSQKVNDLYKKDLNWWESYKDPELNRLVDLALKNNNDLAQSALTMRKAMYEANLKESDLYPTVSSSLGGETKRNLYQQDSFSKNRTFSGELSLSYELDLWNKLGKLKDAATFEYQATSFDLENTRLTLINSVIDVYFNLAYLNNSIKITKNSIDNYKQMQKFIDDQYRNGKITELNSLQILQSIKSSENDMLTLQNEIKSNEQLLSNLLNTSSYDSLDIHYPDILLTNSIPVDLNVPISVLSNRPDLKASELRLSEALANLDAEKKSWYPSITLGTALKSSDSRVGSALSFPILSGNVSLNLPFLSWNTIKNNINISKTEYESLQKTLENNVNTALNEVNYYYYSYTNTQAIFNNTKVKTDLDSKIKQINQQSYENGKIDLKDFLESVNTENSSYLSLLSKKYDEIKSENMIFKAMGGRYYLAQN